MSALYELENPPTDAISSLRVSPSGKSVAIGSWDKNVYIYRSLGEGDAYKFQKTVECRAPVLDVTWGADDLLMFCVGLDYDVRRISLDEEVAETTVMSTHEAASNKVVYSKAHNILLSTSWDGTMHVHNPDTGEYIRVGLAAKPFALSLTAERVVVAMAERKVSVYDLHALKQLIGQAGTTSSSQEILSIEAWQQRESSLKFMTRAVACMLDGTGFATSSIEGRVGVEWFDPEAQKNMYAFKCHRQSSTTTDEHGNEIEVDLVYPVNALAFHPVHGTFATGGGDGVVTLWDAQSKRRVKQYQKLGASVAAMDFSPDGKSLFTGISPGFEDGKEDDDIDRSLIKVIVRELKDGEAKGKAAKS